MDRHQCRSRHSRRQRRCSKKQASRSSRHKKGRDYLPAFLFAMPCQAGPRRALPRLASPSLACHARPRRALPRLACPALSRLSERCLAMLALRLAVPRLACRAEPCRAIPSLAPPSLPCRAIPSQAMPSPACLAAPSRAQPSLAVPASPVRAAPCRASPRHATPALPCPAMPRPAAPGLAPPAERRALLEGNRARRLHQAAERAVSISCRSLSTCERSSSHSGAARFRSIVAICLSDIKIS
jgi:hypothetical protein